MEGSRKKRLRMSPEDHERLCMMASSQYMNGEMSLAVYDRIIKRHRVDWVKASKELSISGLPQPLRSIMRRFS